MEYIFGWGCCWEYFVISVYLTTISRSNDFPFQNWPISVSHFHRFHLTDNFYRFRSLLAISHQNNACFI